MSLNGSGVFNVSSTGQPVVANTLISAAVFNAFAQDVATALSTALYKDGQQTVIANLPMASYRHTGVGAASSLTDYARADQLQNSALSYLTSVSGADTITASAPISPAAYAAGQTFRFVAAGTNTTAVTLNVSSLGAKDVTKNGTTALVAGDIPSGAVVEVVYDGTQFQLVNVALIIGTNVQAYSASASQAEMEAGTEAALRSMSPLRVAQAIAALGGGTTFATTAEVTGTHTTGSITSGTAALTVASGTGISNGDYAVGEGITPGTTVSSGGGTTSITLSANANATLSADPVGFYDATVALSPGNAAGMLARAWVNFNGTGTVAIRASFNVSSIADNGTGRYTINFTAVLPDANFSCVAITSQSASAAGDYISNTHSFATGSASVSCNDRAGNASDAALVSAVCFR